VEIGSVGSEGGGFVEEGDSRSDAVAQCHHCKTLIFFESAILVLSFGRETKAKRN